MKGKSSSCYKVKTSGTDKPNQLQIVRSVSSASITDHLSASSFKLPLGWTVEKRPRRSNHPASHHSFDTYYYEPGTGRQFRSMISIQRYLNGETMLECRPNSIRYRNVNNMQIIPCGLRSGAEFNLPEGWLVEEQPRKNVNYAGHIDKTYIEPGTKKRFRSLLSAEKYLAERKGYAAVPKGQTQEDQSSKIKLVSQSCAMTIVIKHPIHGMRKYKSLRALEAGNYRGPSNDSGSQREKLSGKQAENSALISCPPPAKIKWVLNGLGGNVWSPVIDGSPVSKSVKQKWSESFFLTLNNRM